VVDEETRPGVRERQRGVVRCSNIPEPPFWGVRVRKDFDLRELFPYINETAAVQEPVAVEDGVRRKITCGSSPRSSGRSSSSCRKRLFRVGCLAPQGGVWVFPRSGDGMMWLYMSRRQSLKPRRTPRGRKERSSEVYFPRQREGRKLCISDFLAPRSSGKMMCWGCPS